MSSKPTPTLPSGLCVLVPVSSHVHPGTQQCLDRLREALPELPVEICYGSYSVNRSQHISDALAAGWKELLIIDSDMEFTPAAVLRLALSPFALSGAFYSMRGTSGAIAGLPLPSNPSITFGPGLPPVEVLYLPSGFIKIHSDVFRAIETPVCRTGLHSNPVRFIWGPQAVPAQYDDGSQALLGPDFALCHQARLAGFRPWLLPDLRVGHWGDYCYQIGDKFGQQTDTGETTILWFNYGLQVPGCTAELRPQNA